MNRFEKWSVWSTTFLTAATGIGFYWAKYLAVSTDPFSVINHPLQPVFLKLHILVAPLFLFALGTVAVRHIWHHFRSGIRRSRKSGVITALAIGPMILTGYLLQVVTGEGWLRAMAFSHIGFGLLYLTSIGLHQWFLRQPATAGVGSEASLPPTRIRAMRNRRYIVVAAASIGLLFAGLTLACDGGGAPAGRTATDFIPGTPPGGLVDWVKDVRSGLRDLPQHLRENPQEANQVVTELYLSRQEYIERYYGAGGPREGGESLSQAVLDAESRFHDLMRVAAHQPPPDSEAVAETVANLESQLDSVLNEARSAGVSLAAPEAADTTGGSPQTTAEFNGIAPEPATSVSAARLDPDRLTLRTAEVASVVEQLRKAEEAYRRGEAEAALSGIERAYLEGFEPLEPRLPVAQVRRVEGLIHLQLRPQVAARAPRDSVSATFGALYGEMQATDDALAEATPFWLAAFNSFAIVFREGLEAVLLIGAILAYLSRVSEAPRHRRQVYLGMGLGIAASFGTWLVAHLLIPMGGASREMIEGITGLLAVAVLLYVSNWLFQKTYVYDWKEYLTERVGRAVTTGSALAMATLAFAAVYREGFETVLFYQALLFDTGAAALLAGFIPGLLLITGVGVGIVKVGLRLPLNKAFAATNAILIYLAYVFVGKGIYSLQEAGVFAPTPVPWMPDHGLLRQLVGMYPMAEPLLAQATLLLLIVGSYLYYRRRAQRSRAAASRTHVRVTATERA